MTPQEVEQRLGMQYAQTLRDNAQFVSVREDCSEIINGTLNLLEHYNKVTMAIRSKSNPKNVAGLFS